MIYWVKWVFDLSDKKSKTVEIKGCGTTFTGLRGFDGGFKEGGV